MKSIVLFDALFQHRPFICTMLGPFSDPLDRFAGSSPGTEQCLNPLPTLEGQATTIISLLMPI